jgi:DNA mismatch endonuclease (patch repair protein)
MKHQKLETTSAISKRLANIDLKKGKAETILAKALWHKGIRYRLNYKKVPGSPDICITSKKIAVFVDGEFWHGHDWKTRKKKLKSNRDYWIEKIEENIARDKRNNEELNKFSYVVLRFWEKEVLKDLDNCVKIVEQAISCLN